MRLFLLVLVSFVALTAVPAGITMAYNPDGAVLGLSTDMLEATPFKNYLIPGLALALIVGGCNLISVFFIMGSNSQTYKVSILGGIFLIGWIVAQMLLSQYYTWLQGLYLLTGVLITLLSYHLMGKAAF